MSGLFEKEGEHMYVIAEQLNLREEGSESADRIGTVAYYTEVATYGDPSNWYKVKVLSDDKKGYMSAMGLANETDMLLLNSVWGDSEARSTLYELEFRRALIDFRKRVVEDENCKIYGAENKGGNIFKFNNTNYTGFAFIADNKITNERLAVIYLYDEDGNLLLENTDENVKKGQYIRDVKRNSKGVIYLQYGGKAAKKNRQQTKKQTSESAETTQAQQSAATEPAAETPKQESSGFHLERIENP